jgi:hypothetical protein
MSAQSRKEFIESRRREVRELLAEMPVEGNEVNRHSLEQAEKMLAAQVPAPPSRVARLRTIAQGFRGAAAFVLLSGVFALCALGAAWAEIARKASPASAMAWLILAGIFQCAASVAAFRKLKQAELSSIENRRIAVEAALTSHQAVLMLRRVEARSGV